MSQPCTDGATFSDRAGFHLPAAGRHHHSAHQRVRDRLPQSAAARPDHRAPQRRTYTIGAEMFALIVP